MGGEENETEENETRLTLVICLISMAMAASKKGRIRNRRDSRRTGGKARLTSIRRADFVEIAVFSEQSSDAKEKRDVLLLLGKLTGLFERRSYLFEFG